ncbi:MAG: protein phosphatase 2C domain-containing protein [Pseudomonadota bacterium]
MRLTVLGSVNDPGTPGKTGDDRFGHDESAGRAWVLDGATDVSPLKPFPNHESGAAWYAETLSSWLTAHSPEGMPDARYWTTAIEAMRDAADTTSEIPLHCLPKDTSPIAALMAAHLVDGRIHFSWLGDSMALVKETSGDVYVVGTEEKADAETDDAKRLMALSEEARMRELRNQRAAQNTHRFWVFGLDASAADHVKTKDIRAEPGLEILLMTDGLFRLISPYKTYTPRQMFDALQTSGLDGLINTLRDYEAKPGGTTRIKQRDDSCGVWLRVGA